MKRKLLLLVLVFIIIVCIFNSRKEYFEEDDLSVSAYLQEPLYNVSEVSILARTSNPDYINFSQLALFDEYGNNVARDAKVTSLNDKSYSDGTAPPSKTIDGSLSPRVFPGGFHSATKGGDEYINYKLAYPTSISRYAFYNRADCCADRANGLRLRFFNTAGTTIYSDTLTDAAIQEYDTIYGSNKIVNTVTQRYHNGYATDGIQYVRITPDYNSPKCINFSQLALFDANGTNVARNGSASCVTGNWQGTSASTAIDGTLSVRNFPSIAHCGTDKMSDYFELNLRQPYTIVTAVFYNRGDCCADRANGMSMNFYDGNKAFLFSVNLTSAAVQTFDLKFTKAPRKKVVGYEVVGNGKYAVLAPGRV